MDANPLASQNALASIVVTLAGMVRETTSSGMDSAASARTETPPISRGIISVMASPSYFVMVAPPSETV